MIRTEGQSPDRLNLRQQIVAFPVIMEEAPPQQWWRRTAGLIANMKRQLPTYQDDGLREYMSGCLGMAVDLLRQGAKMPVSDQGAIAGIAEHLLMDLSMKMAERFEPKELELGIFHIGLPELVASHPDRLRTENQIINGVPCTLLHVKHPTKEQWQSVPLPNGEKIWHKGGPARVALDVFADAPESMQQAEHPWNDFDAVIAGDTKRGHQVAHAIGVDPDGVEMMGEDELNFRRFCFGRDTQQNQVLLGADGLYFSEHALKSAQTGHINIVGEYIANKAIYGIDRITMDGISMAKPRGLMRLVKSVAEGKALSFDHKPANSNFDMGVYALFLAKKWAKKPNFPELLQRMYHILGQIGQVREGENDIFTVLERAHHENPFFDFDREIKDEVDLVRWKARKFAKQIDREAAWLFSFPTTLQIERTPNDDVPYRVSLDGFITDEAQMEANGQNWADFLSHSRERTKEFNRQGVSPLQRMFLVGIEECDDVPPNGY